ncbi:hypothetical protein ZWY2020_030239 [Hordeum vulgare]|nr:hypothetical protein ZWY2020_030239 [Hordeum vulgare]
MGEDNSTINACATYCPSLGNSDSQPQLIRYLLLHGECSGLGCCDGGIPKGYTSYHIQLQPSNDSSSDAKSSVYTAEEGSYNISKLMSEPRGVALPALLDWVIINSSCQKQKSVAPGCRSSNSFCQNYTSYVYNGYQCRCSPGYRGNPYILEGCQDIDECVHKEAHSCHGICQNTPGIFYCRCPDGTYGNPPSIEGGCIKITNYSAGLIIGMVLLWPENGDIVVRRDGLCGECELMPGKVTTCHCGKTMLEEKRASCLDPIATCDKISTAVPAALVELTMVIVRSISLSCSSCQCLSNQREPKWVLAIEERCKFLVLGKTRGNSSSNIKFHVFCPMLNDKRDAIRLIANRWKLSVQSVGWEPKRFITVHVTPKSKVPARVLGSKPGVPVLASHPYFDPMVDMDPRLVVAMMDLPRDADVNSLVLRFGGECELVWLNDKNAVAVFSDSARAATVLRRLDYGYAYQGAAMFCPSSITQASLSSNVWVGAPRDGGMSSASPCKKDSPSELKPNPPALMTVLGRAPGTSVLGNAPGSVWKPAVQVTGSNRWNALESDAATSFWDNRQT